MIDKDILDGLSELDEKCGKESCNSCPHGPYWYAEWTEEGKRKTKYLGKNLTDA